MSIFSMDNEDFDKPGYFDPIVQKKTYTNLIYSLVSIPLNILYFLFTIIGLIVSIVLIPFWIGVPLLIGYFQVLWTLSKFEEKIYERHLFIQLPKISKYQPEYSSSILLLKAYLKNNRSWRRFFYFLLTLFYSILLFIPTLLFLSIGFSMIYIPFNSIFGHINFYNIYETDSYIEVIFIYFIVSVAWVGLLHLINKSVLLSSKMVVLFLCR